MQLVPGYTLDESMEGEPMRRVRIYEYGGYEKLRLETYTSPVPDANEVLIRVRAAGVNYADCIVRMGLYSSAKAFVGLPITPGFEICGEVMEVGSSVTDIRVGDMVIASTLFGGYSEFVVVDQRYVFPKPVGFTDVQAAGLMATYLTAYYALFELAHPRQGQRILIHSAAGGVGTMLVQLAHALGLTVTGVVGASHKKAFLSQFSPSHIIDKSNDDLWRRAREYAPEGFDVICDANGVSTLGESYRHLRRPGKLVVYGFASMLPKKGGRPNWIKLATSYLRTPRFNPLDLTTDSKSILAFNLSYLFERTEVLADAMSQLTRLIDGGQLAPPHCSAFAVEDVALAHREIESGATVGKLVLTF